MIDGQTQKTSCGRMTFGVSEVVVPLPQVDYGNVEAEGMQ